MQGKTWKSISEDAAKKIKSYLSSNGGIDEKVNSPYEGWRIRFSDSMITFYLKGTIYSTPSNSNDPAVSEAWAYIDSIIGSSYALPSRPYLIGLDETGKGEVVGHTVLTGVLIPKDIFGEIESLVGSTDTKKRHEFRYWDDLFVALDQFRTLGLDFVTEKIPPWHVDKFNINKIMDITYQRILSTFLRKVQFNQCRIVVDDYGIGPTLRRFLNFMEMQGAEIITTGHSEDSYLEVRVASIISKRTREAIMKAINENRDFIINGLSVGSGNAGDKHTIDWLSTWFTLGKPWPWFIKKSFKTICLLEGKTITPRKINPPIRENIISPSFLDEFQKGRLSIKSLSLICPKCGSTLKSVSFASYEKDGRKISGIKCPIAKCERLIEDASITLRYYCGYIVPDSSVIRRSVISNDLSASRFFEDFAIVLCAVVRKECDGTPGGKKEFDQFRKYDAMGRIKLETYGKVSDLPYEMSSTVRDENIIQAAIDYNAILLSADKSMSTFATGKNIFTIFI